MGFCGWICNERQPEKPKRLKDLHMLLDILCIFSITEVPYTFFHPTILYPLLWHIWLMVWLLYICHKKRGYSHSRNVKLGHFEEGC